MENEEKSQEIKLNIIEQSIAEGDQKDNQSYKQQQEEISRRAELINDNSTKTKLISIADIDPDEMYERPFFTEPETVEAMGKLGYSPNDLIIIDIDQIPDLPQQLEIRNSVKGELDRRRMQMIQNIINERNRIIEEKNNPVQKKLPAFSIQANHSRNKKITKKNDDNDQNEKDNTISNSENEDHTKNSTKKTKTKKKKRASKKKYSVFLTSEKGNHNPNNDNNSDSGTNESNNNTKKESVRRKEHVVHTDEEIREMKYVLHHMNRPAPISDPNVKPLHLKKRKKKIKMDANDIRRMALNKQIKAAQHKINVECKKKEKKEQARLQLMNTEKKKKIEKIRINRIRHEKDVSSTLAKQEEAQKKLAKKTLLKYDKAEQRKKEEKKKRISELKKKAKEREERIKKAEKEAKRIMEEKQKAIEKKLKESERRSQLAIAARQKEVALELKRRRKLEFDRAKSICVPKVNKTVL